MFPWNCCFENPNGNYAQYFKEICDLIFNCFFNNLKKNLTPANFLYIYFCYIFGNND